jgi:TetR/AcrR family transcriptional regulator, cholesterol catabolism regulator
MTAGTVKVSMKKQKEIIMENSRSLFWKKGYAQTSMKDIAGECGFRAANIYNFFPSKEKILFEILMDEMNSIVDPIRHIEGDDTGDPVTQLKALIENHVQLTLGELRSSKLLFDAELKSLSAKNRKAVVALRDEYNRICAAIIGRGIKAGVFREIDEKMAVNCIASMIVRTRLWFSPDKRLGVSEIIDYIFEFTLRGICSGTPDRQ